MHPTDQTSIAGPWMSVSSCISHQDQGTHVVCKAQHDLWCPIPSRRDVLSHESLVCSRPGLIAATTGLVPPGKAKIADLEFAVSVDE